MPVYVDPLHMNGTGSHIPYTFRGVKSCHMYADTLDELHAMADRLGLKRSWFQDKKHLAHYDLVETKRIKAIQLGALEKEYRHMVSCMKLSRAIHDALGTGSPSGAYNIDQKESS